MLFIKHLLLASVFLFSHGLYANDDALSLFLENLSAFTQYQADFEQQTLDDRGQSMQTLSGSLVLKKPNLFYWQANEPAAQQLISDGKTIWHFDEDLEQVIVQAYAEQKQHSPLLLILENEESVKSRFNISILSQKPMLVFSLRPKENADSTTNTIETIELGFINKQLQSLHFVDVMKQKVTVKFSNVATNKKIDEAIFDFKIPLDADVLYE